MKRINSNTVEMTEDEWLVHEIFDLLLDRGHGPAKAMMMLLGTDIPEGLRTCTPRLNKVMTPEFTTYLLR